MTGFKVYAGKWQIVESFECQNREAFLCTGNEEPFEELGCKQSDINGSLSGII